MNYLKLHLSGVLQYYSSISNTSLRDTFYTNICPTRSAITGLIGSALGYQRNSKELSELTNKLVNIKYKLVNIDQFPITIMTDFQTVRSFTKYTTFQNRQKQGHLIDFNTVDGDIKNAEDPKNNIIKKVDYLQNADFNVYIGSDDCFLKEIYQAIQNPVYPLYLGRKCCIPNKPIVEDFILYSEEDLKDVHNCS